MRRPVYPTGPLVPDPEEVRDLVVRNRELEETLRRVEALIAFYDRHEYTSLNVDDLRRALDGES